MKKVKGITAGVPLLGALLLAGCGGSDGGNDSSASAAKDTTAPVITLAGLQAMTVEAGTAYNELNASALDDIDGNVIVTTSGDVDTSTLGVYTVIYTATDAAGNSSTATREVTVVDTTAPVISLSGSPAMSILAREAFTDPGASATDSFEGELIVTTSGSVSNDAEGTYTLTYSAADSSGNTSSETRTVTVNPSILLSVQAQDYFTGELIENTSIEVNAIKGEQEMLVTGTTDSEGAMSVIVMDEAERIVVNADAADYGEHSKLLSATDQTVSLFLQPVNGTVIISDNNAIDLTVSDLAVVSLADNALVDEQGNAPSVPVLAEITIIDPTVDPNLMPGNFETLSTESGEVGLIESFGAVNVTFEDEAGKSYNLAEGQTATVRIPLASGSLSAPETIPLYYFDEATGYWVEEGSAALVTVNGVSYYVGTVTHFTTWNADRLYETVQIHGCVVDSESNPVELAEVRTQGINYLGTAWQTTNEQGLFTIPAKMNSGVLLSVKTNAGLSRTTSIYTTEEDTTLGNCITLEPSAAVVKLTWGQHPSDLDTQFFGPSSESGEESFLVYFANQTEIFEGTGSEIWLDVDDTSSFGPEITTITSFPFAGRYSYAVKHFSGISDIAASPAHVELNYSGQRAVFLPPAGDATDCWAVFDFVVDETGNVTVETVGEWKTDSYCNADEYGVEALAPQRAAPQVEVKHSLLQEMIERKYYAPAN
ncbi:DUF5011 domain-containing protein [Vibrio sp. B1FLJ16]|uniref:DUF5011 domain-containing protein n=2 Tax=Vibrio sp. B1FLJ16 TaxID=2751178 RepID=UPI0015F523AD|nr:DUF5011 domain-containing protein [Vibrio sp. B1FLJ16]